MGLTSNVVPNGPILSAWGNETRDRALQVFVSAAERGTQWPTPPEGAHSYLRDTDSIYVFNGTAWVWAAGAPLGARLSITGSVNIPDASAYQVAWNAAPWNNGMTTTLGGDAGITVVEAGIYLMTCNVIYNYNGSNALNRMSLTVNGAQTGGDVAAMMAAAGTLGLGLSIANQMSLAAGDKVRTIMAQGSGNAAGISTASHLSLVRQ